MTGLDFLDKAPLALLITGGWLLGLLVIFLGLFLARGLALRSRLKRVLAQLRKGTIRSDSDLRKVFESDPKLKHLWKEFRDTLHAQKEERDGQLVTVALRATAPAESFFNGRCRKLPLSPRQRDLYARAIELFKRRHEPGANVPFKNHLGLLHYLRLICTDPRRHGLDVFKPEPLAEYRTRAPKIDWLLGELANIQQAGEKVIVFCEFRNIQRLLQHYIEEQFGFRPDIINGDTAASASHAQSRQKRIRAFQERPGFGVIILSPVAVGFGVNIQAANHVVHYTRTWNPAKEDQATDRAYRIGQTKDVYVYYPVVYAEDFTTFDVKLDRLLESKRELANDMLNGSGDLRPGEFGLEDVAPPDVGFEDEWVTRDEALTMNWEYFEALTAALYAKRGYAAHRTPSTKDHGVDVVALPREQPKGKLVQAKISGTDGAALDWDAVKDVVTGRAFYSKRFPDVNFELACITNQFFDEQTHLHARLNSVELIEQPVLLEMLNQTPVSPHVHPARVPPLRGLPGLVGGRHRRQRAGLPGAGRRERRAAHPANRGCCRIADASTRARSGPRAGSTRCTRPTNWKPLRILLGLHLVKLK